MAIIISFFVAHWVLSVFFQTFYLHRYGAHRMFTMSKGWERFFHLCTFVFQGPSFLNPRAYAYNRVQPEPRFDGGVPVWPAIDRLSQSWVTRIGFGAAYTVYYLVFAPH